MFQKNPKKQLESQSSRCQKNRISKLLKQKEHIEKGGTKKIVNAIKNIRKEVLEMRKKM